MYSRQFFGNPGAIDLRPPGWSKAADHPGNLPTLLLVLLHSCSFYTVKYATQTNKLDNDAPLIVDEQAWVAVDYAVMALVYLLVGWYNWLASCSYIVLLQQQHSSVVAICSWPAYVPGIQPYLSSVPANIRAYYHSQYLYNSIHTHVANICTCQSF